MKLSNKTLGLLAILGAPFLFLEMKAFAQNGMANSSITGVFDLIYMLGWMCTIIALLRMQAAGLGKAARVVIYIQLALLCIANVWNIWNIINPASTHIVYKILDWFWPASNTWMLVVGVMVMINKKWKGWRRYSVLVAGLWLPMCFIAGPLLGKYPDVMFYFVGFYSVIAWSLMGIAVFTTKAEEETPLVFSM